MNMMEVFVMTKKYFWGSLFIFCSFFFALCAIPAAVAGAEDFVAVAFTGKNYTGVSWVIPSAGGYDLWDNFDLPNDSICSIRVRPGYAVTLYEHSEFGGTSATFDENTPDLNDWNRSASSLRIETNEDSDDDPDWMQGAADAGAVGKRLEKFAENSESIDDFAQMYEPHWYGGRSDESRVEIGGQMLELFEDLGCDVSEWTPNTFAQQMNNFFDWRKSMSVWQDACLNLNVDPDSGN
jgi:hypothetical protein